MSASANADPVNTPTNAAPGSDRSSAIEFEGVMFAYRRGHPILRGLSISVPRGSLVALLGESGGGKTTVLKLAKGLIAPKAGVVRVFGEIVANRGVRGRLSPVVAYIPQQLGLTRNRSALENVLVGGLGRIPTWRSVSGFFAADDVASARGHLERLGIGAKWAERVRNLSGGERQRVAIARALMQNPSVILADEFVSQLDPATTHEIMTYVRAVVDSGVTVLMTTHEVELVQRFADHVVVLRDGQCESDRRVAEADASKVLGVLRL